MLLQEMSKLAKTLRRAASSVVEHLTFNQAEIFKFTKHSAI